MVFEKMEKEAALEVDNDEAELQAEEEALLQASSFDIQYQITKLQSDGVHAHFSDFCGHSCVST